MINTNSSARPYKEQKDTIVVDIGGSHLRVGAAAQNGTEPSTAPTPDNRDSIISLLEAMIASTMTTLKNNTAVNIVIGCPGLVSKDGLVKRALYLDLAGVHLRSVIETKFSVNTIALNDANLQAMAFSSARDTLLYLVFGTGVGGAILSDGELLRGKHGFAGEFGHVPLRGVDTQCRCGQRGCIDALASGAALVQQLGEAWWVQPRTEIQDKILGNVGFHAGEVVRIGNMIIDPSTVVVAGHLANYDAFRNGFRLGANLEEPRGIRFEVRTWPLAVRGAQWLMKQAEDAQ